ncbi:membrane bound O-acyl transferase family-domain-containing protein [Phlebopus sp. FC_14]|nr:membrane bound O-acyl transferase family-domain-containing protein [Phlebopus sp. FC_14]
MDTPPLGSVLVPPLGLAVLLTLDATPVWRVVGFCVVLSLCLTGVLLLKAENPFQDYLYGATLGSCALDGFHLLFLVQPLHAYWHESDRKPMREYSALRRWFWVACMSFTPRGVGWNYKVKNVPEAPRISRRAFLVVTAIKVLKYLLFLDVAHCWVRHNPVFSASASIASQGYFVRCINIVAFVGFRMDYYSMNISYLVLAILSVAAGVCEPRSWPNLYGRWRDAYTVRRFWGHTWHQLMRRWVSSYGKYAARMLGFKSGSQASSYTQLYVGFLVSATAHMFGDVMMTPSILGISLTFFVSQACAITVEDVIIAAAKKVTGVKRRNIWTRAIGYAWVCWWFCYSLSGPFDAMIAYASSPEKFERIAPTMVEKVGKAMGWDVGVALERWFAQA